MHPTKPIPIEINCIISAMTPPFNQYGQFFQDIIYCIYKLLPNNTPPRKIVKYLTRFAGWIVYDLETQSPPLDRDLRPHIPLGIRPYEQLPERRVQYVHMEF